ncbi:MAG TPA: cyclophane-forming radical SAM/SPASM peptide maturase GrrM/OscB [Ktedonobacteraceae bacterium]
MHTQLVVIQPTAFCNINCQYCYLSSHARSLARRIEPETLEQVFKVLFASPFISDEILFVWHAGEPLVLPIDFYERALQSQERWNLKKVRVTNAIQTNATLITQKWCQFFQAREIHVGVSLDGPQALHDAYRTDRAGHGTFERVMRGIQLLRAHAIPYTVISVITNASVSHPKEFWDFFAELAPQSIGLNPEEAEGANLVSSLRTEEDVVAYKAFVQHLLALNASSSHPLVVREIEELIGLIDSSAPTLQTLMNMPMGILSFDYAGNFSTFSPELLTMAHPSQGDFLFGNVFANSLEDLLVSPKFLRTYQEIQQGINLCKTTCAYFPICGGGSPSNKLQENGSFASSETMACRLQIQAPADALLEHLEASYNLPPASFPDELTGYASPPQG